MDRVLSGMINKVLMINILRVPAAPCYHTRCAHSRRDLAASDGGIHGTMNHTYFSIIPIGQSCTSFISKANRQISTPSSLAPAVPYGLINPPPHHHSSFLPLHTFTLSPRRKWRSSRTEDFASNNIFNFRSFSTNREYFADNYVPRIHGGVACRWTVHQLALRGSCGVSTENSSSPKTVENGVTQTEP